MTGGNILPYRNRWPRIAPNAFIAPGSTVIGDVVMAPDSSVWFNCAVRGDVNHVRIGPRSNVQDGTIIHTATKEGPTIIGADVVVGHMCLLHACILEDSCMIGMGAVVMDYAVVEAGGWVAAGALVPPGKRVKRGELWMGRPAKYVRDVSNSEREDIARIADNYVRRAREYREMLRSQEPFQNGGPGKPRA